MVFSFRFTARVYDPWLKCKARLSSYKKQDRGTPSAYAKYLNEMNASMRDKIATIASFIPCGGAVADMGTGSGLGSYHLACLYPDLTVTGIDINPEMIKQAKKTYQKSNLHFQVGDIAKECVSKPQQAIINCSVLHHVTSFNGYDYSKATDALNSQKAQLVDNGILIVRDFIAPGDEDILLDFPEKSDDIPFFLRFTQEFRKLHANPGCLYQELGGPKGIRRFQISHRLANEFILRKDYKQDWDLEIQEEYTYGTMKNLQRIFIEKLGLRLLSATHIRNPWVISNRYQNHVSLRDLKGNEIDFPATNCILVGQKVKKGDGISFKKQKEVLPLGYLNMTHYQRTDTKDIFDLVKRPGRTLDIVPFFKVNEKLFVVSRMHYPRPILGCNEDFTYIDGSIPTTYATEPLNLQLEDTSFSQEIEKTFLNYPEIHVKSISTGIRIFPSPGGIEEEIVSSFIEIDPIYHNISLAKGSGFSTSGTLGAIEAHHLLRASQVGALRDARLELNVYKLLHDLGITLEPWIGESVVLKEGKAVIVNDITKFPKRRLFRRVEEKANFLNLNSTLFEEKDSSQNVVAEKSLEYVIPKHYSIHTIAIAILRKHNGEIFIGLDDDDRPAKQSFDGHSNLWVAPAWRLPKQIDSLMSAKIWVTDRLSKEYHLTCTSMWQLGSSYHPSPGVTPEIVFPFAVEVDESLVAQSKIKWARLNDLIHHRNLIIDGHLHILMLRADHATKE